MANQMRLAPFCPTAGPESYYGLMAPSFPLPSEKYSWRCLSQEAGHFLFGYYDRCPFSQDATQHLALKIPSHDRLPLSGELADVGVIESETGRFSPLAKTEAWCHQMGAMTQWIPGTDNFLFNDFAQRGNGWQGITRILDTRGIEQERLYWLSYVLSNDGRYIAGLDFNRIPRRGYSYARAPVPSERLPDLDGDGVFLTDLHTRERRLVASYRSMLSLHPLQHDWKGQYLWLNHLMFNRDDSRLLVLLRHCENPTDPWPWRTNLYTMALDGSDLTLVLPDIYWKGGAISHQCWGRTPSEILVDADWCHRGHEYLVFDSRMPMRAQRLSSGLGPMGHLNFSPDGSKLLADTYPDEKGIQRLALVDCATGEMELLGRFRHRTDVGPIDLRCDLHPRWSRDGRHISVDSLHSGERKIWVLKVL